MSGAAYSAAKHGVVAMSHTINMEECVNGIRSCVVCPGEVATPILDKRPIPITKEERARMAQSEDVGDLIRYVACLPPHIVINEVMINPTWNRRLRRRPGFARRPDMTIVTIKAKALEAFVADIFASAGCSADEGEPHRPLPGERQPLGPRQPWRRARAALCHAEEERHGVVADVTVEVVVDTPVIAVVDGKYGFGQTVTPQAVAHRHRQVQGNNGLSAVTLRNAGHVGRVGDWAEMAAEAGLVSIHFVNASGSVLVAPYGGVRAALLDGALLRRRAAAGPATRWCSTSPPRSWPRARCWWRARAARRCPTTR